MKYYSEAIKPMNYAKPTKYRSKTNLASFLQQTPPKITFAKLFDAYNSFCLCFKKGMKKPLCSPF